MKTQEARLEDSREEVSNDRDLNELLYLHLTKQPDPEKELAKLAPDTLRDLIGDLARNNVHTGIPGMIYGMCLVEASNRFLNQNAEQKGASRA